SLPFIFPARCVGSEYFGDGSLRLTAPLSPAIRLGADRILVVGIRNLKRDEAPVSPRPYPSLGNLAGYMLDLIFMDSLDADIERLQRINNTISLLAPGKRQKTRLRKIDVMTVDHLRICVKSQGVMHTNCPGPFECSCAELELGIQSGASPAICFLSHNIFANLSSSAIKM